MDAFKLLARSTTLRKSQMRETRAVQVMPSAGIATAAPLDESDPRKMDDGADYPPRGIKRKRTADVMKQNRQREQQADASTKESLNRGENDAAAKPSNTASGGIGQAAEKVRNPSTTPLSLTEDECRRILKKHKLKITILQGGVDRDKEQKTTRTLSTADQDNSTIDARVQLIPQPLLAFKHLGARYGISRRLSENLDAQGYREPTGVQMGSLPLLLGSDEDRGLLRYKTEESGKPTRSALDLLTIAPTGSGKTLAFMIPLLHGLLEDRRLSEREKIGRGEKESGVKALIIAPTHELVDQIVNEGRKLVRGTGLKISAMKKGMRIHSALLGHSNRNDDSDGIQNDQAVARNDFLVKADILVSAPLLLLRAISTSSSLTPLPLPSIDHLVLDEADVLLDPTFRDQTFGIWGACSAHSLRTSLWSATIGSSIETLAQDFLLSRREDLSLDRSRSMSHYMLRLVVGLKDSVVPNISHRLVYAASEPGKLLAIRQLLHPAAASYTGTRPLQPPFLVFTQTVPRAIALHSELLYDIPPEAGGSSRIAVLHSDLSETIRSNIMASFRKGEIWIIITTDLLSRGIDFRGMNGVVNYDIPNTSALYVHRAGRTGRQGRQGGVAVTLYTKEDIPYVKNVANVIAASERVKNADRVKGGEDRGKGVEQWLLDSLPSVSKRAKKELKRKGVESRRVKVEGVDPKKLKRMRISTKSGYDRRIENRRKGALMKGRSQIGRGQDESIHSGESGWEGFGD